MKRAEVEAMLAQAGAAHGAMARWAVIAAVAAAVASVLLPGVSGWFLAGAALAGAGGIAAVGAFNYLLPSALIRLLAILRTVSRYGERYAGHAAALRTLAGLRAGLFRRLLAVDDPRGVSAADNAARLAVDVDTLEERLVRRPSDAGAMAGAATGVLLAMAAGPWAALGLLAVLGVMALVAQLLSPRLLDLHARDAAEAAGRLKRAFLEQLPASAEMAAFGLEQRMADGLEPLGARLDAARRGLIRGEALLGAVSVAGAGAAMAAVLLLARGGAPVMVLALLGAAGAAEAMANLARSISRERAVRAAMDRVALMSEAALVGGVEVRGETIRIGDAIFASGARVQVAGVSGAGKTRLLETLAGIRPAEELGIALQVDGVPLEQCERESLRRLFAVTTQGSELLTGTVRDNLAMARPGLSDAAMWQALETARLAADVRSLPDGLDAWLGDGGVRLSGGQRKRLALARALAAGRPWLVLDEPTEGLDMALEAEVVSALAEWLAVEGAGLLLASHRPAPIALCASSVELA